MNQKRVLSVLGVAMIFGTIMVLMALKTEKHKNYVAMTQTEILNTPVSELADLPFEELIAISDKFSYSE